MPQPAMSHRILMTLNFRRQFALPSTKVVNTCVSGTANICCEMLVSTLSVVRSLPPLSLANENHISGLGFETLSQVGSFLKQMAVPSSGADVKGEFNIPL